MSINKHWSWIERTTLRLDMLTNSLHGMNVIWVNCIVLGEIWPFEVMHHRKPIFKCFYGNRRQYCKYLISSAQLYHFNINEVVVKVYGKPQAVHQCSMQVVQCTACMDAKCQV